MQWSYSLSWCLLQYALQWPSANAKTVLKASQSPPLPLNGRFLDQISFIKSFQNGRLRQPRLYAEPKNNEDHTVPACVVEGHTT
ncbi:hypothetical protein F5051DRAFT_165649 [Lentinula edodes]|nr:hypothetical protein F5051DRAFT_165649 [Lentinula edodes]